MLMKQSDLTMELVVIQRPNNITGNNESQGDKRQKVIINSNFYFITNMAHQEHHLWAFYHYSFTSHYFRCYILYGHH